MELVSVYELLASVILLNQLYVQVKLFMSTEIMYCTVMYSIRLCCDRSYYVYIIVLMYYVLRYQCIQVWYEQWNCFTVTISSYVYIISSVRQWNYCSVLIYCVTTTNIYGW